MDGKAYCRCPLDKEGQNCDKGILLFYLHLPVCACEMNAGFEEVKIYYFGFSSFPTSNQSN